MCNLLVNDATREASFTQSARLMTKLAQSEIEKAAIYIENFDESILEDYKTLMK